jgi:hypothetical protein
VRISFLDLIVILVAITALQVVDRCERYMTRRAEIAKQMTPELWNR